MGENIRAYICSGCGIGQAMDVARLHALLAREFQTTCQVCSCLCSPEAMPSVVDDLKLADRPRVLIAACSPRAHAETFCLPTALVERVNLRELVAWSHAPGDPQTQALAEDYLRMGLVKIWKAEPAVPHVEPVERAVLVVGGGVAGMTAALEVARAGYKAVLVEKGVALGGWLARFPQLTPQRAPYRELEPSGLEQLAQQVRSHPMIEVLASAQVESIEGEPGRFHAVVRQDGVSLAVDAGAIIQATGWQPYDASRLAHLGYGRYSNVVTSLQIEDMARSGRTVRPSDGRQPRSVAFVLCAGSRDDSHLPYCSSVCCLTSLKQALYVRQGNPEASVYILYRDMRTPGHYEDFYRRVQEDGGVFFAQGDVTGVAQDGDDGLLVDMGHSLLGEHVRLMADMVVLVTGMVPAGDGLHLRYRQGPELPSLRHGYPDSNYLCFPYETRRTGIYAAGAVREPMGVPAAAEDATGAALKAIQCLELVAQGAALHPRTGDLSYPIFSLQRCTQCKRCTEECPFGALDEDEKGTPKPFLSRCRRCGVCMGACPERLVSFANYSVDILSSMVKAIPVPEEETRVLAFVCENDAYPAFDMAGTKRLAYDPCLRIIPVRCLGSVNVVLIADALSRGIDGILLLGCLYGDDYQCHFVTGSELAQRRMDNVRETMGRLRIEPERVRLVPLAISDSAQVPNIVNSFVEEVKKMGPNPYKGF